MYSKLEEDSLGKRPRSNNDDVNTTSIDQSLTHNTRLYDEPDYHNPTSHTEGSIQLRFEDTDHRRNKMGAGRTDNKCIIVIVGVGATFFGLLIGIIIGWFSNDISDPSLTAWIDAVSEADDGITQNIIDQLDKDSIAAFLETFTSKPHLAGTPADKSNAEYVQETWKQQGLSSRIVEYDVLLSYPDPEKPNFATILNDDNSTFFQSQAEEAELEQGDRHPDAVSPFNAYSPAGTVFGDLVYVNYARVEDFQKLKTELGISVEGKIVLARYGKIYRGDKEYQASLAGAIGMILYSDTYDYAVDEAARVYPETVYMPGSGIQRGSLFRANGDPLTPAYPATEDAFREQEEDVALPTIPVQPIGYDDAKHFLQELGGDQVPEGWAGSIPGVTYRLGPGLKNARKVKLEVYNIRERRTTYNVIGMIKGSLEPDRYVVLGNHRDAWVFGAVDPSSGTAVMMELSRVLGKLFDQGTWQPRRSIVFCSWGAEEYGLIGSTEWIEEFGKTMGERTVAYLNVDIAVQGNHTFRVKATPSLFQATYDATKKIPDAAIEGHNSTVYDTWLNNTRDDWSDTGAPSIKNVGSGSDYATLLNRYGIPAVDLRYTFDPDLPISSYPLYHSMYETYHLVSELMDPTFECHLAVARVWGEMARNLADSLIIPMNVADYTTKLKAAVNDLKQYYETDMLAHDIRFDAVDAAVSMFETATKYLTDYIDNSMDKTNPFEVRKVNDQIMLLERAFIDPLGLPYRPLVRHVIFAPSSKDQYKGDAFPGIVDLMFDIENAGPSQWDDVAQHMSVIAYTIRSAASTLMDVGSIAT